MTHRAAQVIDAVVAAIKAQIGLPVAVANVHANRSFNLADDQGEMPAITVNAGDDEPLDDSGSSNLSFLDSLLSVVIVGYAMDTTESLVMASLFDQRRRIHQALMTNDTLGLGFVSGVRYGGASAPELDATTERVVGKLESKFAIYYRMNFADPGA